MISVNRILSHAAIIGTIVALVLPAQSLLSDRYARERRRIETEGRSRRTSELIARWNMLAFTDPVTGIPVDSVLAKIQRESLSLTEQQKDRLALRVREILGYLQKPTFDEYYRLKTEGILHRFERTDAVRRVLTEAGWSGADIETAEKRRIVEQIWNSARRADKTSDSPKLTAVCLDCIKIATSSTNSIHSILNGKVAKGFTVAESGIDVGFRYWDSDVRVPADDPGRGLFVHLSLFARCNATTNAGPIYISLFWSEPSQNWALSKMLTDASLGLKTLF